MSASLGTLLEMGFPQNRAEKAIAVTNDQGPEAAMEWLLAHMDDPDIDEPYQPPQGHVLGKTEESAAAPTGQETGAQEGAETPMETGGAAETATEESEAAAEGEGDGAEGQQEAKCLVCDECGKKLRTENDVQMHAVRSGHQSFSESTEEIKPLTEEEKQEQLRKVQERLKQRRQEKAEEEKKEAIEKEKMRRRQGKELVSMKTQHNYEQSKKLVAERKREKMEERMAKQRVKDQIERDRLERAAKFGKAGTSVAPVPGTAQPPPAQPKVEAAPEPKKDYEQTRIQVRLFNGTALTQSFKVQEELAAVRLFVEMNRTDGDQPFQLMTTFPRKIFTEEDMHNPLNSLGLVPSAVLVLTKLQ
ncbi:UBX domain-containing protein 1-like [Branchiostoma lanceolatum]|uniref:UBX domain-containing protein 1-like n=1 Tax=Branchiostoma lanceolatum TaxID=7740 RepID=UPI003452B3EC